MLRRAAAVSTSWHEEVGPPTGAAPAVGPEETSQNLPSGNNRCTGALSSHYRRALAEHGALTLIRFSGWSA